MALTVEFIGICTHFNRDEWPQDEGAWPLGNVPHRVLLPEKPGDPLFDGIPDHYPVLAIPREYVTGVVPNTPWLTLDDTKAEYTWKIDHVAFELGDQGNVERDSAWSRIPRLRGDERPHHVADPEVVQGNRVHALFDAYGGTLSTFCTDQATSVSLTLATTGNAILRAQPIGTGGPVLRLTVTDGATITISHVSNEPSHDDDNHFGLHFAVAKQFLKGKWSHVRKCGDRVGLGPDCSNSGYP
jgi:hypothetical protein